MHINGTSIVSINGKSFVSGLMWTPLSHPRAFMAEARAIGKRENMDIVAIRQGDSMIQAGFVAKGDGVTKGMYSLAATLAGQIREESWIGAFLLPDGQYALVAVYGGLIVPGCDCIGGKQSIQNLLLEKDSQPRIMKFEKVYHPDDFDHRGQPLDIEELLVPGCLKKEYTLKQLTFGLTKEELIAIACAGALVVSACIGYWLWNNYQVRQAQEEFARQEQIRQQQLAELQAKAGSDLQVKALEHPWASMPGIEDFLNACQGAINALPLAVGGWTVESAICTGSTLEAVYARTGGTTFSQFIAATHERFPVPPVLLEGGDRAGLGDEISLGAGGDDELLPADEVKTLFTSQLQQLELKADFVEVAVAPIATAKPASDLPGQEQEAPPPPLGWKKYAFSVTTQYAPETVFSSPRLNGVRLTEIAVSRSGIQLSWSIKGEIYAR